jgi:hypothetical protein
MVAVTWRRQARRFGTGSWYSKPCERAERWMGRAPGTVVSPSLSHSSPPAGSRAETHYSPRHVRRGTAGSPVEVWFESTGLFRNRR